MFYLILAHEFAICSPPVVFFQEYDISKVHVGELKPLVYILHAS